MRNTKTVICEDCGKEIVVNKHTSTFLCDECRKRRRLISRRIANAKIRNKQIDEDKIDYCKICGRKLNNDLKCDNQFCNEHHFQTFKTLIKYFGFDENKLGTLEAEEEFYRIKDMLYDMYWNQQMSSSQICKAFDYPSNSHLINNVFFRLNILPKTISQSLKEAIKNGAFEYNNLSNNQYKSVHHITWDNREVYLRSSYEEDYANYLDQNKTKYEVEKLRVIYFDTQKEQERIAIPDFYLPETNTIVEVKSEWTLDKQNMIDKRKSYLKLGYNFELLYEHKFVELDELEQREDNINKYKK